MHGMIAWTQGFEPLGQKMIANTNQMRSKKYYESMMGEMVEDYPYEEVILTSPINIANGFDFVPYTGTMEDDREREAGHFTNLLTAVLKDPEKMVALTKLDLNKTIKHIFGLYGIKNFKDFQLNPEQLEQELQTSIMPDAQLAAMQQQGQVEPVPMPNQLIEGLMQR